MRDPVREFIRAFDERDLDGFVAVLDPKVELHSGRGLRKGLEAARQWATREPGGVQQTIELEQLYEDGTEGGGGRAVALIVRRWHWDGERRAGRRRRDGLGIRAARAPGAQLAPLRGPRRGSASRRLPRLKGCDLPGHKILQRPAGKLPAWPMPRRANP